jgi:RNA polymerase primary sigma factor
MLDDVTRDCTKRMHYAAYRASRARSAKEAAVWEGHYRALRDRVVVGNHKLVYRAVRRRGYFAYYGDDLVGECSLVLIRVVAAYNPWIGVRFSTYAYTCLMRALSRLGQRLAGDRLTHCLRLDALPDGDLHDPAAAEPWAGQPALGEYLADDHPLLSACEKYVLRCRYGLVGPGGKLTLETVGRQLGLTKERVRQVQRSALAKLRRELLDHPMW